MLAWLLSFLGPLLKALLPEIIKAAKPTAEEGMGPGELEDDMTAQLEKEGWLDDE